MARVRPPHTFRPPQHQGLYPIIKENWCQVSVLGCDRLFHTSSYCKSLASQALLNRSWEEEICEYYIGTKGGGV